MDLKLNLLLLCKNMKKMILPRRKTKMKKSDLPLCQFLNISPATLSRWKRGGVPEAYKHWAKNLLLQGKIKDVPDCFLI